MERPSKLQRLHSLRRATPFCSKSALHGILKDISQHGVPEMSGPKEMREATRSFLSRYNTYGPLFVEHEAKTTEGGLATFMLLNVFSLLEGVCRQGGAFYTLLKRCAEGEDSWSRLVQQKQRCAAKDFNLWQQATGWTFSPECIFSEPLLRNVIRPVAMFVHDWMHCCLSNGTLNEATWRLLKTIQGQDFSAVFGDLEKFVDLWTLPASIAQIKLGQFLNQPLDSKQRRRRVQATLASFSTVLLQASAVQRDTQAAERP